jgi:hypothetical protein
MNLVEVLSGEVCAPVLVDSGTTALSWENIDSKPAAKAKIMSPRG